MTVEVNEQSRPTIMKRDAVGCKYCGLQARLIDPQSAARSIGITTRLIYRLIEANKVHFVENKEGQVLVCQNSLMEEVSSNDKTERGCTGNAILLP